VTRRQKQAHLAGLREKLRPGRSWRLLLFNFIFLTVVLFVGRIAFGEWIGKPQLDIGTAIWAPLLAAALVAIDVYRNRKRLR
jgi:hypothetical protein